MIPRLANRSARMHAVRSAMGEPGLESLAAEFALLAQRRSRAIHQMQILEQQRNAAAAGFARLQKRIAWLIERIDAYAPRLRDPAPAAVPEPQPRVPQPGMPQHGMPQPGMPRPLALRPVVSVRPMPAMPALSAEPLTTSARPWVAAQPTPAEHPARPRWARRI